MAHSPLLPPTLARHSPHQPTGDPFRCVACACVRADDAAIAAVEPWMVDDLPGFEGEPCVNPVPATTSGVRVADEGGAGAADAGGMLTFDIRGTSQQQAEAALAAAEAAAAAAAGGPDGSGEGGAAGDVEVVDFDAGL